MYRIVIIVSELETVLSAAISKLTTIFMNHTQPHCSHLTDSVESFSFAPIRSMCHFTFSKAFTIPDHNNNLCDERHICAVDTKQYLQMLFRRNYTFIL